MNTPVYTISILVILVLLLSLGYTAFHWTEQISTRIDLIQKSYDAKIRTLNFKVADLEKDNARLKQDKISILEKSAEFNEIEMKVIEDLQTQLDLWKLPVQGYFEAQQKNYMDSHK